MSDFEIAIIVIIFLMLFVVGLNIRILQVGKVAVIERLGAFHKIIDQPGIFFLIPIFERVVETVDVNEKTVDVKFPDHDLSIRMIYKVNDVKLFVYASLDSMKSLKTYIENTYLKNKQLKDEEIKEIIDTAEAFGISIKDFIVL